MVAERPRVGRLGLVTTVRAVPAFDISDLEDDQSLRGPAFCAALTRRFDEHLASVFEAAEVPAGVALVAIGGYGRGEQCPGSDLDVVLLHAPGLDVAGVAERIWYPLWDAGLKLGHQVGTVAQLLEVEPSTSRRLPASWLPARWRPARTKGPP